MAHLVQSRIDEAIRWFERARNTNPAFALHHAWLAVTFALEGNMQRAVSELSEARGLSGDDRYSSIARLRAVGPLGVPKIRALFEATNIFGLRRAVMAEE